MSHVGAEGAVAIVVAVVGSVLVPVVNVVDVPVMFHPEPDPVASPTSNACEAVAVRLVPFSVVPGNVTFAGALTKPRLPAVRNSSGGPTARPPSATRPSTVTTWPTTR